MAMTRTLALALLVTLAGTFAGCFGGGAEVQQNLTSVSQGQQLSDLKRALDDNAITQDEYNRLQHKILNPRK